MLTLVLGLGEEFRDGWRSPMSWPAAEGGSLAVDPDAAGGAGEIPWDCGVAEPDLVVGFCTPSGLSERENVFCLDTFIFEPPAMYSSSCGFT